MKNADLPPALLLLTARPKAQTNNKSLTRAVLATLLRISALKMLILIAGGLNLTSASHVDLRFHLSAQNEEKKMLEFKKYNSIAMNNDQLTLFVLHMEHEERKWEQEQ